jgi:hypothetical protein
VEGTEFATSPTGWCAKARPAARQGKGIPMSEKSLPLARLVNTEPDGGTMRHSVQTGFKRDMMKRMCWEYLEMPGLVLNREQARRLWRLDHASCAELLDSLVETRFLRRRSDGKYVRASAD